ncbi:MAG: TIR domain-containing protein [Pseudomonadota bacterium]
MAVVGRSGQGVLQKRRVFFSFYYQEDIWRVNQVRNSWRFRRETERLSQGFFDGSIWEASQRTSDESLKSLIRSGVENTSVTCVLIGANTHARRWVRYEIAQSLVRRNGLLGIKIHGLKNQAGYLGTPGVNPLECMGVYLSNGSIKIAERVNRKWKAYSDYTRAIRLPMGWTKPTSTQVICLNHYAATHVYSAGRFAEWVSKAASDAGKA